MAATVNVKSEKQGEFAKFLAGLAAGAGSGMITKTAIAPLERIKILFQVQSELKLEDRKYRSITQTIRTVVQEEGAAALWKGNAANVMRVIPVYALKFGFNDKFKDLVRTTPAGSPMTFWELLQAGTLAGTLQNVITHPLDTIRTNMSAAERSKNIKYSSVLDCGTQVFERAGLAGLYRGLGVTLLTGAPYVGLQMTLYATLKEEARGVFGPDSVLTMAVPGAVAGVIAQTICFPGDTIRRRLQVDGMDGSPKRYRGNLHLIRTMLAEEGIAGFYRGVVTNAIRAVPGASIQFVAYDSLKHIFSPQ